MSLRPPFPLSLFWLFALVGSLCFARDELPPPPQKTTLEFSGHRSFSTDQLTAPLNDLLQEINTRGLTRPLADDTAFYLGLFYRKNGFPDVDVDWEIRGSRLYLRINEGPRTYLRHLKFEGNQTIPEATLFDYLLGMPKERLETDTKSYPFVQSQIESGTSRIRGLYESEGFLNAIVDPPDVQFSKDRQSADVRVHITEGQRFLVGEIRFSGQPIFPRERLLHDGLNEAVQAPYTAQRVQTMQRNLQFFFKSQGYYQAEVSVQSDPSQAIANKVPITFEITPHQLYRFDGIKVQGRQRLRENFLPNRLKNLSGQLYDPAKLDEHYRELLRTGLFRSLHIDTIPQPDNSLLLDIKIEEAKAKEIGFSIGAGSYEGFALGLRLADRNLFGAGRPLSFDLDVSQRTLRGELLYVDPWFLESEFSLRSRIYAQSRDETGYSKQETGVRTDLSRKLNKQIELAAFLQFEDVAITQATIEPQFLGPTHYQIATAGLTQTLDFRNHPINPSRGWVINGALDVDSIAGELAFARGTARFSYYHPIGEKLLLALGARMGVIVPFTEIPIDERYFSGGANTVRSFRERELGPKDRFGNPIGGEAFSVFNAELTFPIKGSLQGAVFVDAGNLVREAKDLALGEFRYGIGAGLRYKLPIGPLRLDAAINPTPSKNEEWGAFHFSFGFAF